MRTFSRKTFVIAASTATALALGGIAYAWYAASVSGTGTGDASAASSTIADVQPLAAASAITGLVPGGSSQPATVTLKNTNAFSVHVPAGNVNVTAVATGPSGCDTMALSGIHGTGAYSAQTIAAGGTVPVTVNVSMTDLGTDQTPCNGGSFTLTYTAS
jgi:hypothetical protein